MIGPRLKRNPAGEGGTVRCPPFMGTVGLVGSMLGTGGGGQQRGKWSVGEALHL